MNRVFSLLLAVFILCSACMVPAMASDMIHESDAPVADNVSVTAYAAVVMDMKSGQVLYDHAASDTNYPASTTKVMTALLCLEKGNLKDKVTVSSQAVNSLPAAASTGGISIGEEMTVYRLLQSMLVVSACEAANAIGEYIAGSQEAFVEMMNEKAQELGCEGTHFANCHGLPNSEHYTTARDLAVIARAAMEYDTFREIVGSAITTLEATNVHGEQRITSTNGLLPGSSYPSYNYPYAIGVKTGHASTSGYNLISASNKDGLELIVVVMGCGSRESSFAQSIKLFDWAYENYDILTWGNESTEAAEILEEAPEYEDIEDSTMEEEEVISIVEIGQPLSDSTREAATPVEAEASLDDQETAPVSAPEASPSPIAGVSSSMMHLFIGFAAALVLILILVIVLIVVLIRRHRS